MNIVMASSDLYSMPGIVTIKSLLHNNTDAEKIDFYYICNKISNANKAKIEGLVKEYGRNITFIDMPTKFNSILGLMRTNAIVYSYCYLQDLLPCYVEKALLIETDTVINDSLKELYDINIDDYYLAAADDFQSKYFKQKIGLHPESPYFNCGVMLMNLKKIRQENISSKITQIIQDGSHKFLYEVQDEMNYCLEGHIKLLPPKYNCTTSVFLFSYKNMLRYRWPSTVCTEKDFMEARNKPTIIHFTKNQIIQSRPWMQDCMHPYCGKYKKILSETPACGNALWRSDRKLTNKIVYCIYSKVSQTLTAAMLGVIHAYLYPKFLYKYILK